MSVELYQKKWALTPPNLQPLFPGQSVEFKDRQIYVNTPNIVFVSGYTESGLFYVKSNISKIPSDEGMFGGVKALRWTEDTAAVNQRYKAQEDELLRHPLVGRVMTAPIGVRMSGARTELLDQGFRVEMEKRGRKSYGVVTTDTQWTPVKVTEGRRRNVYPDSPDKPQAVRAVVMEGRYQGKKIELMDSDLKVPVLQSEQSLISSLRKKAGGDLNNLNERDQRLFESMGMDNDLLTWLLLYGMAVNNTYNSDHEVTSEGLSSLMESAASQGINLSQPDAVIYSGGDFSSPVFGNSDSPPPADVSGSSDTYSNPASDMSSSI